MRERTTDNRAVRHVAEYEFFTFRRWDDLTTNYTEGDVLSAPMSDASRLVMRDLLDRAMATPGEWIEYRRS